MNYRKKSWNMRKKDILINTISLVVVVILIIVISKFISNRKEAADVTSSEISNEQVQNQANQSNEEKKDESWFSNKTNQNSSNNTTENNSIEENTVSNSNTTNNSTQNEETNKNEENKDNTTKKNTKTESTNTPKENTNTSKEDSNTSNKKENSEATEKSDNKSAITSSGVNIDKLNEGIKTERQGVIYLTFDDGPSAKITPQILDILKEQKVKATFFVINYSKGNEHLLKREADEGHTIGIHGYSHEYSKIYKSKETFMDNVYSLQKRIKETTGRTSTYTRFPGGSSNTVSKKYCSGIMTELAKEMINKGFKYFDWNISSGDAGGAKTSKDVYNNVTKNLKKDRQNMVLMHDFATNQKGADALTDIIEYGKDNGYTFMAIDDKTPFFAQHISN